VTFVSDDRSVEGSRPVELYVFTSQRASPNEVVARSTSYHRDVVFGGFTFTARTIRRGAAPIINVSTDMPEMTVEVDLRDPAAQFWFTLGSPPQKFTCRIQRIQQTSGTAQDVFQGTISECRAHDRTATFTITQQLDDPLATTLPGWQVSKRCQHTLFDTGCGIDRDLSDIPTTISAIGDFKTLTVASVGGYDEAEFVYGELLHVPSGERRNIRVGAATRTLTLDVRLPSTAANADAILIWRGCDKKATTCRDRYSNIVRFGGCNQLPRSRRSIFDRDVSLIREDGDS